jgi:hypothetical protein
VTPRHTLAQFLDGSTGIDELLLEGPRGVRIVPGASGIAEYADLDRSRQQALVNALRALETRFDYVLIDTAAGIASTVVQFVLAAAHALLVISPDPDLADRCIRAHARAEAQRLRGRAARGGQHGRERRFRAQGLPALFAGGAEVPADRRALDRPYRGRSRRGLGDPAAAPVVLAQPEVASEPLLRAARDPARDRCAQPRRRRAASPITCASCCRRRWSTRHARQ